MPEEFLKNETLYLVGRNAQARINVHMDMTLARRPCRFTLRNLVGPKAQAATAI